MPRGDGFKRAAERRRRLKEMNRKWSIDEEGVFLNFASTDYDDPRYFNVEYYASKENKDKLTSVNEQVWKSLGERNNMEYQRRLDPFWNGNVYITIIEFIKKQHKEVIK